jgi:hypothetical protein
MPETGFMSKDLQEKSDKIIKELKDSLAPISEEIRKRKCSEKPGDSPVR